MFILLRIRRTHGISRVRWVEIKVKVIIGPFSRNCYVLIYVFIPLTPWTRGYWVEIMHLEFVDVELLRWHKHRHPIFVCKSAFRIVSIWYCLWMGTRVWNFLYLVCACKIVVHAYVSICDGCKFVILCYVSM